MLTEKDGLGEGVLGQAILYWLARALYRSEVAHSAEMKQALSSVDHYADFRPAEIERVVQQILASKISLENKVVLDFGCNDGALSRRYLDYGAARVVGIDIDVAAIARAKAWETNPAASYLLSTTDSIPVPDASCDIVISYDVFEHVAQPRVAIAEIARVLRPGGRAIIGTQGWHHPFAPHLWSTMPVPWAHVLFSEATLLSVCRRVYTSRWYNPNMHDFDSNGSRIADKYLGKSISRDYLNHFLIQDYERTFRDAGFLCNTRLVPFSSRFAWWTRPLLNTPLREYLSAYAWFELTLPDLATAPLQ